MAKRISTRAIIIDNDELILMFRRKINNDYTQEYYSLAGGQLEMNETLEECLKREIKEEFNLDIAIIELLGTIEDENNLEYVYNTRLLSHNLQLGGEEKAYNNPHNYYEIRQVKITDFEKYNIKEESKKFIRQVLQNRKKEYNEK